MNRLCGNNRNYKTLTSWMKSRRFPHAILLEGPVGSGKQSFAEEIGKMILCSGETPPCGQCNHCVKMDKNIHPDYLIYEGEKGKSFYVEEARGVRTDAWVMPNDGERKVMVLLGAGTMTVQAQNALLKTIEEPPKGVYFILTCENQRQLLSTIISRVVTLTMDTLDYDQVVSILRERTGEYSDEDISAAALLSDGIVGRGLAFLESEDGKNLYANGEKAMESWTAGRELEALGVLSGFEKNRAEFIRFLEILKNLFYKKLLGKEAGEKVELTSLQIIRIVDIIDEITTANNSNVNLLLLTTRLSGKIDYVIRNG